MPEHTQSIAEHGSSTPTAPARRKASLIGVDIGGTKTHIAVIDAAGERSDIVIPSASWCHGPVFDDTENFTRLVAEITAVSNPHELTSAVFGLHDCDTKAQELLATAELSARLAGSVLVINDAALLGPAAGVEHCIQLIVGTGSIIIGQNERGDSLTAEGYGWLLGDSGSAPALTRDAVRLILHRSDRMVDADPFDDPLVRGLAEAYGASNVAELALAFTNRASPTEWGANAPLVFASAALGSRIAIDTIDTAAATLANGIAALLQRGAVGTTVVAAGGVIVNQPVMQQRLSAELSSLAPELTLQILTAPPVDGALALARRAQAQSQNLAQKPLQNQANGQAIPVLLHARE